MATAIYMRVSTEMQERDGVSLDAQKEQLQAYCTFKGLTNVREFVDVGSARTTNRDNFKKMMQEVESGRVKNIVIYRLDRLTRSLIDLNKIIQKINELDCALHSSSENIDTKTATGRMIINLIGTFAQWESDTISERVTMAMDYRASQGKWHGAPPYGYVVDDGKLEIKEDEAAILREAFDMILEGDSVTYVEGNISRKYNLGWKESFLGRKIRSEHIVGNTYWRGNVYKDTHEGILTKSEKRKFLQRIEENSSPRRHKSHNDDIFRRKIKCYKCKHILVLSTVRQNKSGIAYYYRCNNCRRNHNVNVSVSEANILQSLYTYLNKIKIDKIDTITKEEKSLEPLYERLSEIKSEKDNIQRAWIKDLIDEDALSKYLEELNAEQTEVEEKLDIGNEPIIDGVELKEVMKTLKNSFKPMEKKDKRSFVQRFVKFVEFDRRLQKGQSKRYNYTITNVEFY